MEIPKNFRLIGNKLSLRERWKILLTKINILADLGYDEETIEPYTNLSLVPEYLIRAKNTKTGKEEWLYCFIRRNGKMLLFKAESELLRKVYIDGEKEL